VALDPDPLRYDAGVSHTLVVPRVPKDGERTGALVGLLRRMLGWLPEVRPDLAECALVWSRLFTAAHREAGRRAFEAAFATPTPERGGTLFQARCVTQDDRVRLRAMLAVVHPHLHQGVERGTRDGVTDVVFEPLPPSQALDLGLSASLPARLTFLPLCAGCVGRWPRSTRRGSHTSG
jgi:hypothetical protein